MYYLLNMSLSSECFKHLTDSGFNIQKQYDGYIVDLYQLNDILEEIYNFQGKKLIR